MALSREDKTEEAVVCSVTEGSYLSQPFLRVMGSPLIGEMITKLMIIFFIFLVFLNHGTCEVRCESKKK